MPLFYGAGLVSMVCNNQFKRLGDLAAGTVVVYQEDYLDEQVGVSSSDTTLFTLPLEISVLPVDQQKLIVEFCERSGTLSNSRQAELAGILKPLVGSQVEQGDAESAIIELLKQSGNKLMGR